MIHPTPAIHSRLIAGILFLALLSGCTPARGVTPKSTQPFDTPSGTGTLRAAPWASALRALDPADAATPAYDLTAVYLRMSGADLQIRIDLLDFQNPNDLSLDIRIGDDSDPVATPLEIHIPSESESARISLDPQLDTVIAVVPLSEIPTPLYVDVSTPADEISGLTLDGPVPTQSAPLLLTFYNSFAGRFPAEALRSWDGAHSGPRGERHGLKHLLDAAEEYQVSIVLLDLKEPENLSALDAMDALPRIRQLSDAGLLILPDQPEGEILFGLSPSPFAWDGIPFPSIGDRQGTLTSRPTFVLSSDPSHIYRPFFSAARLIPVAAATESAQPTPDGPSLEVRRALLDIAFNADEKDLLVLGGDLRLTNWGSPDMVGPTLAYFASRPYFHILSADELMDFPTKSGKSEGLLANLNDTIPNLVSHYENLTRPVFDFVENWDGSPLFTCNTDINKDGIEECIFADENFLAILDPQGARLTYLFFVRRNDIPPYTQLIGPSWQVAVGLSDPSTWDLSAGEAADPGAYPGAFADADDPFKPYEPVIDGNTLLFRARDGTRTKSFKLTETGIEVKYQTQEPVTTQIPLLVEPGSRFMPGWAERYVGQSAPGGVVWGVENGPMISVQAEGAVTMWAFNESLSVLSSPEDPDYGYPPGHYIPFSMAVVEVGISGDYSLSIERR